ncbi:hypothetical protein [Enterococcus sp. AZ007]|uniref:hypothetical protein n=1 Tax=Enterococcus sp. AZ007 TaxID=2774839 RepID=UPI003F26ED9F
MNKVTREVREVAKQYGYERLTCIIRMDITRYSAMIGKTGVKILVDIQTARVWRWSPFRRKLILEQRKVDTKVSK